jgi:hypothetical protein
VEVTHRRADVGKVYESLRLTGFALKGPKLGQGLSAKSIQNVHIG